MRVALALATGLVLAAAPAMASHHHHTSSSHHGKTTRKASKSTGKSAKHEKAAAKPSHPDAAAAKGVLSVPAGGIKLFCGPGHNPLLIRKMTQGNGTTVTVVCR